VRNASTRRAHVLLSHIIYSRGSQRINEGMQAALVPSCREEKPKESACGFAGYLREALCVFKLLC
jgi:hypothetical protein